MRQLITAIFVLSLIHTSSAQVLSSEEESSRLDSIIFTPDNAASYLQNLLTEDSLWRPEGQTLRNSLERLIDQFNEPFDSVRMRLSSEYFDSVKISFEDFVTYDSMELTWLNDSIVYFSEGVGKIEPFITTLIPSDTSVMETDSIPQVSINSLLFDSLGITLYRVENGNILNNPYGKKDRSASWISRDSRYLIVTDTTSALVADNKSPFLFVPNVSFTDSLEHAMSRLLTYTYQRDSTLIFISDVNDRKTAFWLSARERDLQRYWVKNTNNDSITVWVGNPGKYEMSVLMEEDLYINRMRKVLLDDISIISKEPDLELAKVKPLKEIPVYWEFDLSTNFVFSQTYLENWSKGGQSAISTLLDIKALAKYTDTKSKTKWENKANLKYGSILTKEDGLRTNTDIFEINSQYNKEMFGKFDFSASFYMRNQIAKGRKFTEDSSYVISKFLSPSTFTIALGVEYKPFKDTQLNFSPLSYKNTFVSDPDNIDVTLHGIEEGKRSLQEMGTQLLVTNKLKILDGMEISNSLRLFSSYFNNPENIDVNWDLNVKKRINWYFTISGSLQLIYDDDVLFPDLDGDGNEITLPDGSIKKSPKLQVMQFVGLAFAFNF